MVARLRDAILYDTRANQPSAGDVDVGTLYFVSDEDVMERSNGSTWDQVAINASGGSGDVATDSIWDAKGDLAVGTGANTAAKLTADSNGRVLVAASGETTGLKWAGGLLFSRRLWAQDPGNADATFNQNSTSYNSPASLVFYHDWDFFPATHFLISCFGRSNASGESIVAQLATQASPTGNKSSGGDDLSIAFNAGANAYLSSGWIAVSGAQSGIEALAVAVKGSTASVDFVGRWLDIAFKIA